MMRLLSAIAAVTMMSPAQVWSQALDEYLSPSRLPFLKHARLYQVSSYDTSGGNADFVVIPKDQAYSIARIQGPGLITRIWMTVSARDTFFPRKLLVRIYWDGEETPSVEVPFGDFFGSGFGYRQYVTPFLGMSSGGYYCMFPMPFARSAHIQVVNETDSEIPSLYFHVDYYRLTETLPQEAAYFHAQWRREVRTQSGRPYTILEARGEGHVVGVIMNMQSYDRELSYLEGDERVFVDGESQPSIHGTGTEDYFTSGWYFNRGEYAGATHGLILKDDSLGRIAAYRFHVSDAVPFRSSLLFTIEHGHANTITADYSSVAFWYQREPHYQFPALPRASQRIPLRVIVPGNVRELEEFASGKIGVASRVEEMGSFGPDWSGGKQLLVQPTAAGEAFTLTIPGLEEEEYRARLYYTCGPAYGDVEITSGEVWLGGIAGFAETVTPAGAVDLGKVRPSAGSLSLRFVVKGRNARSSGYAIGLDALSLEPQRRFIPDWQIIGPFPNPTDSSGVRKGLDTGYGPEREVNVNATYSGVGGATVRWVHERTPADGYVDLAGRFTPGEHIVAYASTFIQSPRPMRVPLLLGSDDGVKVYLNGKEVHRALLVRVAGPDQDRIMLDLLQGWNTLVLKIENNLGGFGFYARLMDKDHVLRLTARR